MLRNIIFKLTDKKIKDCKVNISLNKEIPTPSLREISSLVEIVKKVNSYEAELKDKPQSFFKEKTFYFKNLIREKTQYLSEDEYLEVVEKILDDILPFYFALVREVARRVVKMRHFDVQILGGVVLHKNKIAEMATGEGKTLVATLAASLNALCGKGVHIVTVNDYLAKRDREWMGPIYEYLGLTCGVLQQEMGKEERKLAYGCDITYGTNNEFGFDYLRDNMVTNLEDCVQREHFYAIVDEVDSILIDEARTPLIISGPAEVSTQKYYIADNVVKQLKSKLIVQSFDNKDGTVTIKDIDGTETKLSYEELENQWDAIVEEKTHQAYFTSRGEQKCEKLLGVKNISEEAPDKFSNPWSHYLSQALRAHYLFHQDKDYIVKDGKVIIVDEFTGRLMPGRRWSDNLHQAIEAKEKLKIQEETQTLATITLQNYFRMYKKLAGMTGTAYTEANEFKHIYNLDVVVIPTNRPLVRTNYPDRIYKSKKSKFQAVVEEIEELYRIKRPVLVGTTSIEDSEELSFMLTKKGIPHNVLNAKYHEKEAYIVAQAGRLAQVTIATNMAGRGTDIILGGNIDYFIKEILKKNEISFQDERYNEEYSKLYQKYKDKFEEEHRKVVELGGLHIIGTQRHESRRIDNQLRGRAGRQGDPGSSRFYISLEDDLMRLFGNLNMVNFLMNKLPEDQPIEHPLLNNALAIAQKRVEAHNFEIRKQLLEYDNVMNEQREVIYKQRRLILEKENIREEILEMIKNVIEENIPKFFENEDTLGTVHFLNSKFCLEIKPEELQGLNIQERVEFIKNKVMEIYQKKELEIGKDQMFHMEKNIALWVIDSRWKEHLLIMDSLKEGIYLRGYAQTEPLVEYQKESHIAFTQMISNIKEEIVEMLFKTKPISFQLVEGIFEQSPKNFIHSSYSPLQKEDNKKEEKSSIQKTPFKKIGRNEPCPCGSGKKYKKCCGR